MILILSFNFLTKIPQEYYCTYEGSADETQICKPADFCEDPTVTSYTPNMDLPDSYDNWILRFDLHCASKMKIGIIGASPFIGWVATLWILPRISDLHGRSTIMQAGNVVTFMAFTVLMFTESFNLLIASILIMGAMSTIRVQIGIIYMYESLTKANF